MTGLVLSILGAFLALVGSALIFKALLESDRRVAPRHDRVSAAWLRDHWREAP